jgi:DNA-binding transcriptional ArsR family regulator
MKTKEHTTDAQLYQALADPTRLDILRLLIDQPGLRVCQIFEQLNLEQAMSISMLSHHLRRLRACGLVEGKYRAYHVPDPRRIDAIFLLISTIQPGETP